jgi:hypothetical protein
VERNLKHLKSLLNIEKPVQKQVKFNHEDLIQALFLSHPVLYTDKPFKKLRIPSLRDVPVTFSLKESSKLSDLKDSLSILSTAIIKYNNKEISDPSIFRELPGWIVIVLMRSFSKGLREWYDYLNLEMKKFCETTYSKIQWQLVKVDPKMVFREYPLSYGQTIWVAINSGMDKKEQYDMFKGFQESLLPWLNIDLWRDVEKKKKNTRYNVDYEEYHKKMVEEATPEKNDDLDIVT